MATIYDEIKVQFENKLNLEIFKNEIEKENLNSEILKLGINILIEQIKKLRKNNFIETTTQIGNDANEILKTIDTALNETK